MTYAEITTLVSASATAIVAIFGIISWTGNLREKRRVDAYVRKEQVYKDIVVALQALYKVDNSSEKQKFIDQTRITWIYCPDDVVQKLNIILDTLSASTPSSPAQQQTRQKALGDAVAAMRKDLMPKTTLTGDDFRHLTA